MQVEQEIDISRLGTLEPFSGEPVEMETPPELLLMAFHYLDDHYQEADPKSCKKVQKSFDAITKGKLIGILPDGKIRVQGSSSVYLVDAMCIIEGKFTTNKKTGKHGPKYCPTYQGGKQGSCYHMWMRELVRIAQVFMLTD